MKKVLFFVVVIFIIGFVSAHSLEVGGIEIDGHSEIGNVIFSLVIGIGLVYLVIARTVVEWRKDGKK